MVTDSSCLFTQAYGTAAIERGNNEVVLRRGPRKQDLWRKRTIWHCTASQLE